MIITPCPDRPVLEPCSLPDYNFQVEPYIGCGHYCYYCYVLPQAETDWQKEVLVHENFINRLEEALADIPPQTIYMGWHTDPYQPCEAKCLQTRQVLELLRAKGFSARILTKSDLVLRDRDLLGAMEDGSVSFSVAFSDDAVCRLFEANTIATGARIDAMKALGEAKIRTSALLCPVMPFLSDVGSLVESMADHADRIRVYGLSILEQSDPNWRNVEKILETHFKDLKDDIKNVVFDKKHAFWKKLGQDLRKIQEIRKLNMSIHF